MQWLINGVEMNWIKCSERLPENGQECLVSFYSVPVESGFGPSYSLATYLNLEFNSWELRKTISSPTHWLPLPEVPDETI